MSAMRERPSAAVEAREQPVERHGPLQLLAGTELIGPAVRA